MGEAYAGVARVTIEERAPRSPCRGSATFATFPDAQRDIFVTSCNGGELSTLIGVPISNGKHDRGTTVTSVTCLMALSLCIVAGCAGVDRQPAPTRPSHGEAATPEGAEVAAA